MDMTNGTSKCQHLEYKRNGALFKKSSSSLPSVAKLYSGHKAIQRSDPVRHIAAQA